MSSAFKSKAQQFADQVISDVQSASDQRNTVDQSAQPIANQSTDEQLPSNDPADPQAYRQENRLAEFGKLSRGKSLPKLTRICS